MYKFLCLNLLTYRWAGTGSNIIIILKVTSTQIWFCIYYNLIYGIFERYGDNTCLFNLLRKCNSWRLENSFSWLPCWSYRNIIWLIMVRLIPLKKSIKNEKDYNPYPPCSSSSWSLILASLAMTSCVGAESWTVTPPSYYL